MSLPRVIHVVLSLQPGGLERMVADLTNARNAKYPRSTYIVCLDEPGLLAAQVNGDVVRCLDANRRRFPWDRTAVRKLKMLIRTNEVNHGGAETLSRGSLESENNGNNLQIPATLGLEDSEEEARTDDGVGHDLGGSHHQHSITPSLHHSTIPIVHSHNLAAWQYAVLAARGTGAKVVYTQHGPNPHNRGFMDRLRGRWLSRRTDAITAVSEDTKKAICTAYRIKKDDIRAIPNGVDFGSHEKAQKATKGEMRKELGIEEGAFVVGSVGRFSPEKNYPLLIRAFAEFSRSITPPLHHAITPVLLLIGDGPDRSRVERTIDECELNESCILTGMRSDAELLTSAMDVFCLSSDSEGVSVSLLAAGALGIPAVVTDAGANAEIVENDVSGRIVSRGDATDLAAALGYLAGNPELGRKMGEAASERVVTRFSLDSTLGQYESIYESIA